MRYLAKFFLWLAGWKAISGPAPVAKCLVLGVPHTSNWDFVYSWLYYKAVGGSPNVIVNKKFFFGPVGILLRAMGAIPIDTGRGASVVKQLLAEFKKRKVLNLAIAIEGTRKPVAKWKGGFHTIARAANVPVYYAVFDWGRKEIGLLGEFELTDDLEADMHRLKVLYKEHGVVGKYPKQFIYGDGLD